MYHETVCLFQWSTHIYQNSIVCEPGPKMELYIENSPHGCLANS